MTVLDGLPAPRAERAASALLHDHADARVVGFTLQPGQTIPAHESASTVLVHVVAGSGTFRGADGATTLAAGQAAVFAPGETHAIEAGDAPLRFLAVIAPRPSA